MQCGRTSLSGATYRGVGVRTGIRCGLSAHRHPGNRWSAFAGSTVAESPAICRIRCTGRPRVSASSLRAPSARRNYGYLRGDLQRRLVRSDPIHSARLPRREPIHERDAVRREGLRCARDGARRTARPIRSGAPRSPRTRRSAISSSTFAPCAPRRIRFQIFGTAEEARAWLNSNPLLKHKIPDASSDSDRSGEASRQSREA